MHPYGLAKSVNAQTKISTQQVEPIASTQGGKQAETSKFNLESGQLTVAF